MPYRAVADLLRLGSQASFAVINIYRPERDITVTKAVSGDHAMVKLAARLLRFDIFAGGWKVDEAARKLLSLRTFTRVGSLRSVADGQLPELAISAIERMSGMHVVYGRGFHAGERQLGNGLVFYREDIDESEIRGRLEEVGRSVEKILAALEAQPETESGQPSLGGAGSRALKSLSTESIVESDTFIPDIYLGLNRRLDVVFANHAVSELGWTRDAIIGTPLAQVLGETEKALHSELQRVAAAPEPVSRTWPEVFLTHSGEHFRVTYVRSESDTPETDEREVLTMVLRDATKEHDLAVNLIQGEAVLRGLIRVMHDAVWVESVLPREVVFSNDHIQRVLGIEVADFMADPDILSRTLTPSSRVPNPAGLPSVEHATQIDYHIVGESDAGRWVRIWTYPVSVPEAPPVLIRMAADVTEERRSYSKLEEQQSQARMLVREMSHRVKNHLNLAVSISSTARLRTADPDVQRELKRLEHGVRSIALVHDQLHRRADSQKIDFGPYCRRLLKLVAPVTTNGGLVRLQADIVDREVSDNTAVTLGLLLTELVTNAARHAFPETVVDPTIGVEFSVAPFYGQSGFRLQVKDNGRRIGSNPLTADPDSMGSQIILALTAQIHGELTFHQGEVWKVFSVAMPSHE